MSFLDRIAQAIYDKKGANILALDLRPLGLLSDYCIIAEGNVDRHIQAIGIEIKRIAKEEGVSLFRSDGEASGEWIILDFEEVVVHLFLPAIREKYQLEALYKASSIIPVMIKTER